MAKKQTRRAVSLNAKVYEKAAIEADSRGMTLSHFVEECLRAEVPDLPVTTHHGVDTARRAVVGRARPRKTISGEAVLRRVGEAGTASP